MIKRLQHLSYEKKLRELFSLEQRWLELGKTLSGKENLIYKYLMGGNEKDRASLLLHGAYWQDKRQWTQTERYKIPSEHKRTLFYCEGDQTLTQADQKSCEDSILADT